LRPTEQSGGGAPRPSAHAAALASRPVIGCRAPGGEGAVSVTGRDPRAARTEARYRAPGGEGTIIGPGPGVRVFSSTPRAARTPLDDPATDHFLSLFRGGVGGGPFSGAVPDPAPSSTRGGEFKDLPATRRGNGP